MKDKKFMEQMAKDMTIGELMNAINIKMKETKKKMIEKGLTTTSSHNIVEQQKTKNLNPMDAYKAMQEGKVCKGEERGDLWKIDMNKLYFTVHAIDWKVCPYIDLFMTETFEVVEKKKSLNDKIINDGSDIRVQRLKVEDVKESLKEFLSYVQNIQLNDKAKEIFGAELV